MPSSQIVHSKGFESAITKLCDNKSEQLSNVEAMSIMRCLVEEQDKAPEKDLPATALAMKKRKIMKKSIYTNVD